MLISKTTNLLKQKIFKILGLLLVIRLSLYIPVPGVDLDIFSYGQDVNPLLKRNKALYNHDSGYISSAKEMKRVASIPPLILSIWAKEYNGTNNWFQLPKDIQRKIMRTKLNSNEFRYFRTAEGNL